MAYPATNPYVLNVIDSAWVAVGDGTTDDTTAIQSALTAAGTASLTSPTGCSVFVPVSPHGGSTAYIVSNTLTIPSNVTLILQGTIDNTSGSTSTEGVTMDATANL